MVEPLEIVSKATDHQNESKATATVHRTILHLTPISKENPPYIM